MAGENPHRDDDERRPGESPPAHPYLRDYPANGLLPDALQEFDELLLEHGSNGVIWLHFAVRAQGNRRKINFLKA